MRTLRYALLLTFLASVMASLAAAQNIVSDDDHRFTVAVPIGWRVIKLPDHMKLTMGDSVIHIMYIPGQPSAAKVGEAALGASGESYVNAVETEKGVATLGGDDGVFVNFQAYDERSVDTLVHVVATKSGWCFFAATSDAAYSSLRVQFDKIEKSFALTKNIPQATPAPEPQKTDSTPHN
ncbi:hypothetical protein Acid345_1796 [Candidatus Koribacter versatilis Ellin345]|uniref:PsbP C-terminal domain-containing protein n=1 Tax=Koribacter versatilis (strain Ellin345) TaxID=204669 RepID=Q1IQQ3_KORVE|nr:hypothetical protein [Candidatus Koribacter versatilis]ABF40797.1 hypothetical protein Acid345_1796 [Candidatus Koribacter versatilis Ellin345]